MNTDVFKIAWPTCNDYILTVGGDAGQGCFYFFHRRKRRTMRAGAEQGRWANASLDWLPQLLKERLRDRDAGMVGFLNSKPSWKTKQSLIFSRRCERHRSEQCWRNQSRRGNSVAMATKCILCFFFFPRYTKKCQR